jgi:hypothetical protein
MCEVLPFLASSMEWRCLYPGRDELTSARLLGRLPHEMAGASFQPSSRTWRRLFGPEHGGVKFGTTQPL